MFLTARESLHLWRPLGAALFGAAIGENTLRYGAVLRAEGQDPAVSDTAMIDVSQS